MRWFWIKIFLILVLLSITTYITMPRSYFGIEAPLTGKDYKLWLDLQWWVELDYSIDFSDVNSSWTVNKDTVIEWLKSIVEKRVNSLGTAEPTIMTAKYWQESHIIVQIPASDFGWKNLTQEEKKKKNDEYIAKAKETIGKVVRLEFKEQKTVVTDDDKKERKTIAEKIKKDIDTSEFTFATIWEKYKNQYEKVEYKTGSWTRDSMPHEATFSWMENVKTPFVSWILESSKWPSYSLWADNKLVMWEEEKWFSLVRINSIKKEEKERDITTWTWTTKVTKKEKYTEITYNYESIFISQKPSEWTIAKTEKWEVLYERFLKKAEITFDQLWVPQVSLTFDNEGTRIFGDLTKRLIGKPIAIYVWWELITAPTVQAVITDGKAVITWQRTVEEAKKLANDINTWIVPAPIYLTSERTIDAKIGWDSLHTIVIAWIIGFGLILTFLLINYWFAWLLAWIALLIYITLTISIVKLSWVVLNLASIAWLVLSVWLAIDANILIFERTKEELKNKSDITKSINIWFDKSWTAIWDSHVTSLVSAVILWFFGVNMIKWFWIMLWIGIIVSLFTAMWVSRVLILAFSQGNKNKLKFFIWFKG